MFTCSLIDISMSFSARGKFFTLFLLFNWNLWPAQVEMTPVGNSRVCSVNLLRAQDSELPYSYGAHRSSITSPFQSRVHKQFSFQPRMMLFFDLSTYLACMSKLVKPAEQMLAVDVCKKCSRKTIFKLM